MAAIVTAKELERQARLAYEGMGYKLFLVNDPDGDLTPGSLATEWEALECSGGGYAALSGVIGAGALNVRSGRWRQPVITWTFTSDSDGFTFTHRALLLSRITTATIATAGRTGGAATITTTAPHGFEVGDVVTIAGSANAAFNGTWTLTGVSGWTAFTFALAGATITAAAQTGTAKRSVPNEYLHSIRVYAPALRLVAGESRGGTISLEEGL